MQWSGSQTTSSALRPSCYWMNFLISSQHIWSNPSLRILMIFTVTQITTSNNFNLITSMPEHINELHSTVDDFFTVAFQIIVYLPCLQSCTDSSGYRIIYKSLCWVIIPCIADIDDLNIPLIHKLLLCPTISPYLAVTPDSQIIMEKYQFEG